MYKTTFSKQINIDNYYKKDQNSNMDLIQDL